MSWNYRVVKNKTEKNEVYYQVCEVYYSDEGVPHSTSENFMYASEELADLVWMKEAIDKAFEKPVLEYVDGKYIELGLVKDMVSQSQ